MTELEKESIRKTFQGWAEKVIQCEAFPVVLIGMVTPSEFKLWNASTVDAGKVKFILDAFSNSMGPTPITQLTDSEN